MAIDKDPSIFTDRSGIGSSDELDEYGVWVKSEPKDVSDTLKTEETAEMTSMLEDSFEPSLPDIEDLPDLEMDTLSEMEQTDESPSEISEFTSELATESMPDFENLPEPENFSVEELPKAAGSTETFEALSTFEDIDFANFEESSDNSGLEAQTDQELLEPSETEDKTQKAVHTGDFTELSMDDFLDTDSLESDSTVAKENTEEEEPFDIDLEFNESVDLNMMSADSAMDIGTVSEAKDSDLNLETVSDFDDFLSDLGEEAEGETTSEEPSAAEAAAETSDKASDFNDIEALHQELEETAPISKTIQEPISSSEGFKSETSVDLSTQLLMKIAEELSSIKKELSTLKDELAVYKGSTGPIHQEQKDVGEEKPKGFFDDEEDEKIALTGDELDNILNTAEFTEEAGSVITDVEDTSLIEPSEEIPEQTAAEIPPEPINDSFTLDETEFLSDKEDLISEEREEEVLHEMNISEPTEENPSEPDESSLQIDDLGTELLEETTVEEAVVDLPVDESIAELQEEGVKPITEAPEDVSYLEEELKEEVLHSEDDAATTNLDLSEAVIEEPDLSGIVLEEHPLEEPSIEDIHIDLDTEEVLHIEDIEDKEPNLDELESISESPETFKPETLSSFEELEEISSPIQEESFEEVLPEGFVVEAEESESDLATIPVEEETLEEIPEIEENLEPVQEEIADKSQGKIPVSPDLTQEIKAVLSYMDQLLESLPEEKIEEFAKSEYFETYKKLFEELGLA